MPLDFPKIRSKFPALRHPASFFDNPIGTQVTQPVIDRMNIYQVDHQANHNGTFETSRALDAVLDEAHAAMADFHNAAQPEEIVFGNNMTSLTFTISRAIARTWQPGDEIIITRLAHDANITSWVMEAEDRGYTVGWVDLHPEDVLDLGVLLVKQGINICVSNPRSLQQSEGFMRGFDEEPSSSMFMPSI